MPRKQAISSCNCCYYSPLPSWKTPRVDPINERLLRYDADARGFSISSSLVRQDPYPQGQDPAGDDLAQSIAAAILDGQVSAELFVDVLPFVYGKQTKSAGFGMRFVAPFIQGYSQQSIQAWIPKFAPRHPSDSIAFYVEECPLLKRHTPGQGAVYPDDYFSNLNSPEVICYQRPWYNPAFVLAVGLGTGGWVPAPKDPPPPPYSAETVRANPGSSTDFSIVYEVGGAVIKTPIWNPGSHEYVPLHYEPNTPSTVFSNTFWALGGNVRHSRCNSCRDFWACRFRLKLGDQERLWMPAGGYAHGTDTRIAFVLSQLNHPNLFQVSSAPLIWGGFSTETASASPSASMPLVKVVAAKTSTPDTLLATAYARATPDNDGDRSPQPGEGALGPLGLLYKPGRSTAASPGFDRDPIAGVSYSPPSPLQSIVGLDVYRNGELIAKIPNTARTMEFRSAAIEAATTDEGSYLLVGDNTADDCGGPMFVLGSLVVDRTPPIGVVRQMGDLYVGDASGVLPPGQELDGWVSYATECVEESEPCSGARNWTQVPGGSGLSNLKLLPVGQYVFRQAGPVFDRAGNNVPHLPELRFNVRALPPSGSQYGAVATLALRDTGRGTFFATSGACCSALLYAEPIESVVVRFSSPISNLQVSHFKLERRSASGGWAAEDLALSGERPPRIDVPDMSDGEYSVLAGNVLLTQTSPREYTLTFRQGPRVHSPIEQPTNSVFYLTLDPELDGSEPIAPADSGGEPDAQQRCRLAARVMWGILPEAGKNRDRINTQAFGTTVGGVSSVTKEIALEETNPPRERPNQIAVRATSDIEPLEKRITEVESCDGNYVPAVPAHPFLAAAGDANYSYFGLGTSIHPSPPAAVPSCAAPRLSQKQSSAICSQGEIVGFNLSLGTTTGIPPGLAGIVQSNVENIYDSDYPVSQMISAYTAAVQEVVGRPYLGGPPLYDRVPWQTPPQWQYFFKPEEQLLDSMMMSTIPAPGSLSFSSMLSGYKCQQNVWAIPPQGQYQGWLTASRFVQSYQHLKTSFLGRLDIGVFGFYKKTFGPITSRKEAIYEPGTTYFGGWPGGFYLDATQTDYNWSLFALGPFTLTPSQEQQLAQGQSVSLVEKENNFPFGSVPLNLINIAAPPGVDIYKYFPSAANTNKDPNRSAAANYAKNAMHWTERYVVTIAPIFA
jgi:hypothetical protein